MSEILLTKQASPTNPATGKKSVYLKTDGTLAMRDEAGAEKVFGTIDAITDIAHGGTNATTAAAANASLQTNIFSQSVVSSATTTAPPGAPADGDCYIVPASATGAWTGKTNQITRWSAALTVWEFYVPKAGWRARVVTPASAVYFDGAAWQTDVASVNGQTGAVLLSQPNLLLNSDFSVNQRAFGSGALAAGVYGHDRWGAYTGGANYSVSGTTITIASGAICQPIESPGLAGSQITVSVENPSATLVVTIGNGTGGNSATGNITAGSGRRGVTLTVPSTVTGDLQIRLGGTGVSFQYPKCEVGAIATPREIVPTALKLFFCQRYYAAKYNGTGGNPSGSILLTVAFVPTMRAIPAKSWVPEYGTVSGMFGTSDLATITGTASSGGQFTGTLNADAEIVCTN